MGAGEESFLHAGFLRLRPDYGAAVTMERASSDVSALSLPGFFSRDATEPSEMESPIEGTATLISAPLA